MKPLEGIKVVDMTHVLAGPYCSYQLGLLGADVVKVESPRGDMIRMWGTEPAQLEQRITDKFAVQNAGKRSIVVDIKTEEGSQVVKRMVRDADVFVENFRPGAVAKYGLDYESLKQENEKLVYVSISAFGQTGPLGHRPGFDDVVQATSGYMSTNDWGEGPLRTGGPVLDYSTGLHATSATLAALMLRDRTGEAQRVDVAMQDVAMLLVNLDASAAATTGTIPGLEDNRTGTMLGRYPTRDGYVMLAGYLRHHCRTICRAIGLEDIANEQLASMHPRNPELEAKIEARLREKTTAEWDVIFQEAGVVAGGVKNLNEVLATGQPEARNLFSTAKSPAADFRITNAGYLLNNEPLAHNESWGVPRLGQQTSEVLTECGFSETEINLMLEQGIVAGH